ncbi:MAG TPA: PilN domain-containing protein [Gemmatimonadales bacterium]|jgi:Tfp pilus assembly protein PilN|nr:PilN domain-containing protein [Gemmatimonadales bacterium]
MIEINLLPGKKKVSKGAGFQLSMPDFKAVLAQVKDPWLIGAIAAWVIVGGGGALLFITDSARMGVADSRLRADSTEAKRWQIAITQKRQFEKVRDSLLYQINVIKQIDADRYIWPHVLDQATKALPPYTWITGLRSVSAIVAPGAAAPAANGPQTIERDSNGVSMVRVGIEGRTVDIQAYTTFLRQLAASPWFTDVTPASSQTVIEADRPVTSFNVTLRYRVADSVYIRTVPLVQAMR